MLSQITVEGTVVVLDGDDRAQPVWQLIKHHLIFPYLDITLDTYDVGLRNGVETTHEVNARAARAIRAHGVGIKCATSAGYGTRKNPTATISDVLGGAVMHESIHIPMMPATGSGPSARVATAYPAQRLSARATELRAGAGRVTLMYEPADGSEPQRIEVVNLPEGGGVVQVSHNFTDSLRDYARATFAYATAQGMSVYLPTNRHNGSEYEGQIFEMFQEVFDEEFRSRCKPLGLTDAPRLIAEMPDALGDAGGYILANPGADDMEQPGAWATVPMTTVPMTTVLITADGATLMAEASSQNAIASIVAWSRGLHHRAVLDGNARLGEFAQHLEGAAIATIFARGTTQDSAAITGAEQLIEAVAEQLRTRIS